MTGQVQDPPPRVPLFPLAAAVLAEVAFLTLAPAPADVVDVTAIALVSAFVGGAAFALVQIGAAFWPWFRPGAGQ
jgi:hypothetical protein